MEPKVALNNRSVKLQICLALIANLSCLAPSMSLGFSAISLPALTDPKNHNFLNEEEASWMASIAAILTPLGCILSGFFLDKYGRKNTLYAVNVCTFLGWALIALASECAEYQYLLLLIGRSFTGISTGMASMPATVYITEITVPKYRGMFTTWTTVSFAFGVLLVYALGFVFKNNWGLVALIVTFLPCLVLFLTIMFLPESPIWLMNVNKEDEAVISMCRLHGVNVSNRSAVSTIGEESQKLRRNDSAGTAELSFVSKMKFLAKPRCLRPLMIMIMFFLFQQFSGTFAILFYAVDMVKKMEVEMDAFVVTVFVGMTRMFGCICMTFLAKNYGRRLLSLCSGTGMSFFMLALSVYMYFGSNLKLNNVPVILFNLFFFVNSLGFLSMPFAMAAELFPTQVRGLASGLCVCFGYLCNFIAVKIYPDMINVMNVEGLFCFYGILALIGTIFVFACLPETRGKSLKEIDDYFSK